MTIHLPSLAVAASLMATVALSPAAAAEPSQWRPVGKWGLATSGERCGAGHAYRSGEDRLVLGLKADPTGGGATVMIEVPGETSEFRTDAEVDFGGGAQSKTAIIAGSARDGYLLYEVGASREKLEQLAASQRLVLSVADLSVELPVIGLRELLVSLDSCSSNLLARWGLSKEDQARIAEFPEPLGGFVNSHDYPVVSLRRGRIGMVQARVTVHPDGSASDCRIVRSSGHERLDETTCRALESARFKPAVDRQGRPMTSPFLQQIRWQVENR